MANAAKKLINEAPPRPIIVKKITVAAHHGHHGGAWKIAYADFVTAMMAFFLLMWLLGMTDEEKRKGLADYFTPTLIEYRQSSAGSDGILGGDSILAEENYPHKAAQTGARAIVIPRDASGGTRELSPTREDGQRSIDLQRAIQQRIARDPELRDLANQIRLTRTEDGIRIDIMDRADFSMFALGTDQLLPRARRLIGEVARAIDGGNERIVIRGHTDSRGYRAGQSMNNWLLSSARAESTRVALERAGLDRTRIGHIEGVADREPLVPANALDPRNRRISILLSDD
jgi:chemotaxis protein MotB